MRVIIDEADSIKTIRAAFKTSITTIANAEVYSQGHSEKIVAEALSNVLPLGRVCHQSFRQLPQV